MHRIFWEKGKKFVMPWLASDSKQHSLLLRETHVGFLKRAKIIVGRVLWYFCYFFEIVINGISSLPSVLINEACMDCYRSSLLEYMDGYSLRTNMHNCIVGWSDTTNGEWWSDQSSTHGHAVNRDGRTGHYFHNNWTSLRLGTTVKLEPCC